MWVRSKNDSEAAKMENQIFVVLSDVLCSVETKTLLHSFSVVQFLVVAMSYFLLCVWSRI